MADSFFEFNTSLTDLELDASPDLDEEEYDALNHETFGDNAFQGDWEEDHTRFAEVAENSRVYRNSFNSEKDDLDLETSISQLVLEEGEEEEEIDDINIIKTKTSRSINIPDNFKRSRDYSSSPVWSIGSPKKDDNSISKQLKQTLQSSKSSSMQFLPPQISRIPTVQELERDLIQKNKQVNKHLDKEMKSNLMNQGRNFYQNASQQQNLNVSNSNLPTQIPRSKFTYSATTNKYPPGFGGPQRGPYLQPTQQDIVFVRNNVNMPVMLGPRLLPPYILPNPHFLLAQNPHLVPPHMMRFMPPHPVVMQQQQQQQQQIYLNKMQNRTNQGHPDSQNNGSRNNNNNNNNNNSNYFGQPLLRNFDRRGAGDFDEYAGLMNLKERQWLRNIQLIQLTPEKPHIEDYYFIEWSRKEKKKSIQEREAKNKDQTENGMRTEKQYREPFFANNRQIHNDDHRERRDSERDSLATPSPRVYVPLQFENSLGKLQCASVTAPRKVIDLDVVSEPQAETVPLTTHRDSRKAKKLLLELERLYLLIMDIEGIDNYVALEEPHLSKPELIDKIISSFLNEDRFLNFMCIRKGKTLLLRLLTFLNENDYHDQVSDLWCRVIKFFSTIVRRDQNDGLLMQMHPFFKKWISTANYVNLSLLASYLMSGNAAQNVKGSSRAVSPNSGKNTLLIALTNKFGVSVIANILSQGEVIFPNLEDKEQLDWATFIFNFMKQMTSISNLGNIPSPLDPLSSDTVTSILNRSTGLHIQDYASAKRVLNCFQ